jgi:hypothetical protein
MYEHFDHPPVCESVPETDEAPPTTLDAVEPPTMLVARDVDGAAVNDNCRGGAVRTTAAPMEEARLSAAGVAGVCAAEHDDKVADDVLPDEMAVDACDDTAIARKSAVDEDDEGANDCDRMLAPLLSSSLPSSPRF